LKSTLVVILCISREWIFARVERNRCTDGDLTPKTKKYPLGARNLIFNFLKLFFNYKYNFLRWKLGDKLALQLYQAFLREPSERNLYADRYHIFFPWMIEVIDDKKVKNKNNFFKLIFNL